MENAEKLVKIIKGELAGETAVVALREALNELHAVEAALAHCRKLVSAAESMLIYGPEGRPSPYGSNWAITPKEMALVEKKVFTDVQICKQYIVSEIAGAKFDTEDKVLMLSRAIGAILKKLTNKRLSIKMTNSSGHHIWINISPNDEGEFIRWS